MEFIENIYLGDTLVAIATPMKFEETKTSDGIIIIVSQDIKVLKGNVFK